MCTHNHVHGRNENEYIIVFISLRDEVFFKRVSLSSLEIGLCCGQLYVSQGKESLTCMYEVVSHMCAGMFWKVLGFVEFPGLATFYSPEAPAFMDPVFEGTAQQCANVLTVCAGKVDSRQGPSLDV